MIVRVNQRAVSQALVFGCVSHLFLGVFYIFFLFSTAPWNDGVGISTQYIGHMTFLGYYAVANAVLVNSGYKYTLGIYLIPEGPVRAREEWRLLLCSSVPLLGVLVTAMRISWRLSSVLSDKK